MNAFDILIGVVVGYGLIRGLFRGLVKEAASILGVIGGFFAAYLYYAPVAGWFTGLVANPGYRDLLAFMLLFCGVLIVVNVVAIVLKYLLNLIFLGWLDRLGGVGLGLAKGVLIVSVVFLALTTFLPKGAPLIKDSLGAPYVARVSERLSDVVSTHIRQDFALKLGELKKSWQSGQ
jgi:membrane protein required for colicin V production